MFWETKENITKQLSWDNHLFGWNQLVKHTPNTNDGILVNSSEYDRFTSHEARHIFTKKAEEEGF